MFFRDCKNLSNIIIHNLKYLFPDIILSIKNMIIWRNILTCLDDDGIDWRQLISKNFVHFKAANTTPAHTHTHTHTQRERERTVFPELLTCFLLCWCWVVLQAVSSPLLSTSKQTFTHMFIHTYSMYTNTPNSILHTHTQAAAIECICLCLSSMTTFITGLKSNPVSFILGIFRYFYPYLKKKIITVKRVLKITDTIITDHESQTDW